MLKCCASCVGDVAKAYHEPTADTATQADTALAAGSPFTPFPTAAAAGTPGSVALTQTPAAGSIPLLTPVTGTFPATPAADGVAQLPDQSASMTMGEAPAQKSPYLGTTPLICLWLAAVVSMQMGVRPGGCQAKQMMAGI